MASIILLITKLIRRILEGFQLWLLGLGFLGFGYEFLGFSYLSIQDMTPILHIN